MKSFLFVLVILCTGCGLASNEQAKKDDAGSDSSKVEEFAEGISEEDDREEKLQQLIITSRNTLDSIDVAYKFIRRLTPMLDLSPDERQEVNEALMQMNATKDLIVLEMERSVIDELKQKTMALKSISDNLNARTQKLQSVRTTIARVSGLVQTTTGMLSAALGAGIIRPRISPTAAP